MLVINKLNIFDSLMIGEKYERVDNIETITIIIIIIGGKKILDLVWLQNLINSSHLWCLHNPAPCLCAQSQIQPVRWTEAVWKDPEAMDYWSGVFRKSLWSLNIKNETWFLVHETCFISTGLGSGWMFPVSPVSRGEQHFLNHCTFHAQLVWEVTGRCSLLSWGWWAFQGALEGLFCVHFHLLL